MKRAPASCRLLAVVLLAFPALAGCADDPDPVSPSPSVEPVASPTSSVTPAAQESPAASESPAALDLEDGRHPVYIAGQGLSGLSLTFDVIQFLTGEPAREAYQRDYPGDPDGPPNDYYILNENPRLRTAPLSDDLQVRLVKLLQDSDADLDPATVEELDAYLATDAGSVVPFWITVQNGMITQIEEQFIP